MDEAALAEIQQVTAQLQQLQGYMQMLDEQFEEVKKAKSNVTEMATIKNEEILVPIANGMFAKATLHAGSPLIVNVGANTLVEKDAAGATKILSAQEKEMEGVIEELTQQFSTTYQRYIELQLSLQEKA